MYCERFKCFQSLMYKDVLDAHNRVKLASELMVFHMHVSDVYSRIFSYLLLS